MTIVAVGARADDVDDHDGGGDCDDRRGHGASGSDAASVTTTNTKRTIHVSP